MKSKKIILLTVLTMLFATNLSTLTAKETNTTTKHKESTYVAPRLGDKTLDEIIDDYGVALVIGDAIGMMPSEILTDELAAKLTILDLSKYPYPNNLIGLEVFPNLKEINLIYMKKASLEGLNKATQIEKLTGQPSDVTDLEVFRGMSGLKELIISAPITDISAASTLTNIEHLEIRDYNVPGEHLRGAITSIEPLKNLTKLKVLSLPWQEKIEDYSPLANLTNLESLEITRSNISVSDLAYISNLDLHKININRCNLSSLNALSKMINLETLYADGSNVSDISALGSLTNLKDVDLRDNHIMDFSVINSTKSTMNFFYAPGNTVTLPKQRAIDSLTLDLNSKKADGTPLTVEQTYHYDNWEDGNTDLSSTSITWPTLSEDMTQLNYKIYEDNRTSMYQNNRYDVEVSFDVEYYGIVNTKYITEDGEEIANASVSEANVGDSFNVSPKTIAGYKLIDTKGKTTGTMAFGQRSEVVYTYEAITSPSTGVDGKEISKPSTATGDTTNTASFFILLGISMLALVSIKVKRNTNK